MIPFRNPFLNPEYPFYGSVTPKSAYEKYLEEERRKNLDDRVNNNGRKVKHKKVAKKDLDNSTNQAVSVNNSGTFDVAYFNRLVIEPRAYRKRGESDKELFYFSDSHKALVKRKYLRHLSFQEQIGLLILHLEGKLSGGVEKIAQDIVESYGEWCNQSVEVTSSGRKKNLGIYEGVTRLDWDNSNNVHDRSTLQVSHNGPVFDVTGLKIEDYNYLKNINKKHGILIEYFYTRPFSQLPQKIQDEGAIWLPKPNILWPVGRGGGDYCDLSAGYDDGASRGVRS